MLVVGEHGLSLDEQQTHFALWGIMSAPLFLGNDVRNMSRAEKEIIMNQQAICINQDNTEQGRRVLQKDGYEFWMKNLKGDEVALLIINRENKDGSKVIIRLSEIGLTEGFKIYDVYRKELAGRLKPTMKFRLDEHECRLLKLTE